MMNNTFAVVVLALILNGCASASQQSAALGGVKERAYDQKAVKVTLVQPNAATNHLFLNKPVHSFFMQNLILTKAPMVFTLSPGKYKLVAKGNGGSYYRHEGKGIKIVEKPFSYFEKGGFKIPDEGDGSWFIWRYPAESMTMWVGFPMTVYSGVTEDDFLESVEVADFSAYLSAEDI